MSLLINGLFAQSARGGQVSALCSKNNPRNIKYMPACPVGRQIVLGWLFFSHAPPGRRPYGPEAWSWTKILINQQTHKYHPYYRKWLRYYLDFC